jgi:hypothetical protein
MIVKDRYMSNQNIKWKFLKKKKFKIKLNISIFKKSLIIIFQYNSIAHLSFILKLKIIFFKYSQLINLQRKICMHS